MKEIITKRITLTKTLAKTAEQKAATIGITLGDYVRYLIVQDNKKLDTKPSFSTYELNDLPAEVEEQYDRDIEETLKGIECGEIKAYDNAKDLVEDLLKDD